MATKAGHIIYNQIKGNRLRAMCGARDFLVDEAMLQFSIPSNMARNKANRVRITLTGLDLYEVEFYRVHGLKVTSKSTHANVYADSLLSLFSEQTGLDVSL